MFDLYARLVTEHLVLGFGVLCLGEEDRGAHSVLVLTHKDLVENWSLVS